MEWKKNLNYATESKGKFTSPTFEQKEKKEYLKFEKDLRS